LDGGRRCDPARIVGVEYDAGRFGGGGREDKVGIAASPYNLVVKKKARLT